MLFDYCAIIYRSRGGLMPMIDETICSLINSDVEYVANY